MSLEEDCNQLTVPPCHNGRSITTNSRKKTDNTYKLLSPNVAKAKGLKIAHLNIRSLKHKIDQLRILLHDNALDVLAISESHLTDDVHKSQIEIDNYDVYRRDRGSAGGGVVVYVKSSIPHEHCPSLNPHPSLEALWVKIIHAHTKPLLLCCVYRPPSATVDYYDTMIDHFTDVTIDENDFIILGDFNFNYSLTELKFQPSAPYRSSSRLYSAYS